jgi:N-acetylglucosamine-6-sulfatase
MANLSGTLLGMDLLRRARLATILMALIASACTSSGTVRHSPRPSPTEPSRTLPPGNSPPSTVSARGKPNFIIILSDDQTAHLFNRQLMPHVFSRLVDQGVDFTRAYVNVSLCCPSRASILTGLYSHHTGVQDNSNPLDGQTPLRPNFAQALHDAGYRTMMDGKYLNSETCDPQPGWDQWVCGQEGSQNPEKHPAKFDGIDPTLNVDGQVIPFTGYTTDILAGYAEQFIEQNRDPDHPFLLYFAPHAPHALQDAARYDPRYASLPVAPYEPPSFDAQPDPGSLPEWVRRPPLSAEDLAKNRQKLVKMTQQVPVIDNAVGRILDAVRDRADDTFVLYMTDNAYMYGEHRILGKVAPYEESVKVPFVIRYPKMLSSSRAFRTDALAENVDVAPTIMELAGIPWEADGVSLVPVLTREKTSVHDGLLLEHCQVDLSDRKCQHGQVGFLPPLWGIETERYQYFEYSTGEAELYDLKADPYEMTNLAGLPQYTSLRRGLSSQIFALRAPPATPGTTIALGPEGEVSGAVRFGFFTQDRTSTFQCRLARLAQSGGWTQCGLGEAMYDSLPPGRYSFAVRAIDAAGHSDPTPAERGFTVA